MKSRTGCPRVTQYECKAVNAPHLYPLVGGSENNNFKLELKLLAKVYTVYQHLVSRRLVFGKYHKRKYYFLQVCQNKTDRPGEKEQRRSFTSKCCKNSLELHLVT